MKKLFPAFLLIICLLLKHNPALATTIYGVTGQYFDDSNLTTLKMTRVDSVINFMWSIKPPGSPIQTAAFSVRWTGKIVPKYTETYRFVAKSDGGVRLWINGKLLVNNWGNRTLSYPAQYIALTAGIKYSLVMEQCRNVSQGIVALMWSSPHQAQEVVPNSQLYWTNPATAPPPTQPSSLPPPTLSNTPFQWQTATPDSQGINGSKLGIMRDVLASRHTQALLIMRNDKTIMEWYSPGNNLSTRFGLSSAAKGVVGGLSLLVALNDGRLAPTDYACKYIAAWRIDSVKSKIKISQLASHTSGLEDADGPDLWMQQFWKRVPDPFTISINDAPVIFTPGSNMAYSNPGFAALGYAVTASLKGQAQSDIYSLLRQRIMKPLGIADQEWTIGYQQPSTVDGMKLFATWGGAAFTARATAKVGRLMLRQGNWNGQQLASSAWVSKELTPVDSRFSSTLCWWANLSHAFKTPLPLDSFITAGDGHRILLVIPSLKLIIVRLGDALMSEDDFWAGLNEYIFEPLMAAVVVR